jgi:hypothetical protein
VRANVGYRMVREAILSGGAVDDSCTTKHLKVLILEMLLIIQLVFLMMIL